MARCILVIVFCLLCSSAPLRAAGPVLHVYLAERFFEMFPKYSDEEKRRFILGTLFPDIRYISSVNRTDTHEEGVTLNEIVEHPSPFVAGMKFHSWVDNVRDGYVLADGIYDRLPEDLTIHQKPSFLKVIEDELLLEELNADYCCDVLETVDPEELKQGIPNQDVERWHAFLLFFFRTSPKTTMTLLSLIDTDLSHPTNDDIDKWLALINPTLESETGKMHTKNLISYLNKKLSDGKQEMESIKSEE